ncbi:acyltransferase family-domain-containing protein [Dactylonectria estremocensis]|uniref:Acyltransferase family-domain-containing protein n=1 Tax=Dactylonectria estremocensis TaxID=1079267 RepID=A0A9P9EDF4_9HYPO|nr:acyltransferase family-domain-containing protein [Dactylonectria estremocensis]
MNVSFLQQSLNIDNKIGLLDQSFEENIGILEKRPLSSPNGTRSEFDRHLHSDVPKWVKYIFRSPIAFVHTLLSRPFLMRLAWFLVPSFLQGRHALPKPAKLSPTAYLDGMRGLAALFVFFCHYTYTSFDVGFAWGGNNSNYDILKVPILRLWYQGPVSVTIFFLISGYALSYRPLKLIRSQDNHELLNTLSSSVFRRLLRLYIPTAIATALVVCFVRLGVYEYTREFSQDRTYIKFVVESHPVRFDSSWDQWGDYYWTMLRMIHVFGWDRPFAHNFYHVHLWTIPIEYRCSLYLFLVILATARLRMIWRYVTLCLVILLSYRHSKWELVMFLFGMGLAEWDLHRGAHVPVPAGAKRNPFKKLHTIFWNCVSVIGLFLMSFPDAGADTTPGYVYLSTWIPWWWNSEPYRPWQSVGCLIFALAVSNSDFWKGFYNSGFIQYLGKISYALYLVHGPVLHMVGYHWEKWAWSVTGVEGGQYGCGFVLSMFLSVPTVFWVADLFWRAVDIPTVKFARWFENQLVVKSK